MQLTIGRVHWGWCVFPLHNQSLTQTLADHRLLVTIILGGESWTLIIILWLNPKNLPNTPHLTQEARQEPPPSPDDIAPALVHPATITIVFILSRKTIEKQGEEKKRENPWIEHYKGNRNKRTEKERTRSGKEVSLPSVCRFVQSLCKSK